MMRITETVKQLLIINVLFFIGTYFVGQEAAFKVLALHSPQNEEFQFWQVITHMFMHGDIFHIFFNMFALFSFGSLLEHIWGTKKFLFFYFSCGIGAAALHLGVNYLEVHSVVEQASYVGLSDDTVHKILNVNFSDGRFYRGELFLNEIKPIVESSGKAAEFDQAAFDTFFKAARLNQSSAVGASGAIYGLLVAFAMLAPNAELMLMFIPIPIKAKYFVPGLVAIDLYLGITGKSIFGSGAGIAHFAHIGGALIGFIMMWYWKKNQFNNNRWN